MNAPDTASSHPAPSHRAGARPGLATPVVAGVVTAVVGFTSSFAVVLAGLRAVGATADEAASGLLAITLAFGFGIIGLALWHRVPVTLAWSTPGAALLVSTGAVEGGWAAAVGAFAVAGLLFVLTGFVPWLARLVERVPAAVAQAMLAGVLLPLVLAPVQAVVAVPALALPVVAVWLAGMRWWPRWAVPVAMLACLVAIGVELARTGAGLGDDLLPGLVWTPPAVTLPALVGIALPLYVVTMASQNVPGAAVLRSFGYAVPWRSALAVSGAGTVVAAGFGGHSMNLAAISAALAAGEEAGPDRDRRWVAAVAAGSSYLVLAPAAALVAAVTVAAPGGLVEAVAGLALLAAFAASVAAAFGDPEERPGAAVALVVAASGATFLGVGGAFWALVAGLLVRAALRRTPRG
ncbi:benzoate/H(+) symporter BenE family transporter [Nocardioides zeae]|uniref:Benzoate/H(+) symporter BenE family transporter n=1 Tax=Nocardioides imazamoxiresistens TaxID=3231893 RepID=A0ABU3PRK4_9ACTN|nr:benzoate/H(+) symporter BenE family transporter [Nocardioides zeae]MDT9591823.1 benzoate/H(+) symporter BenE family transporter [Nocardioides zeae]